MKKKTFTKVLVTSAMATSLLAPQVLGAVNAVYADENAPVTAEVTPETTVQESLQEVIQEVASEPVAEVVAEPVAEPVQEVVEPVAEPVQEIVVEDIVPVEEAVIPEVPKEASVVEKKEVSNVQTLEVVDTQAYYGDYSVSLNWDTKVDAFRAIENAKTASVKGVQVGVYQQSDGELRVYLADLNEPEVQIFPYAVINVVNGTIQSQTYDLAPLLGEEGTITVNINFSKEEVKPDVKPSAPSNIRVSKNAVVANVKGNTTTSVYDEKGNALAEGYYADTNKDLTFSLSRELVNGEKIYLISVTPEGDVYPQSDKAWATYVAPTTVLKSTVTIRGVDSKTGKELYSRSEIVDRGTVYTAQADVVSGYQAEGQLIFDLIMEQATHTHTFYYTEQETGGETQPEAFTNLTVQYIDKETGNVVDTEIVKDVQVGTSHYLEAKVIEGYDVEGDGWFYHPVTEGENIAYFYVIAKDVTTPGNPDTETPDAETPDTETPDTDKPDTEKPDTETPDTETPDTDKPDTETPDTETPDTDKPDTDKPVTNVDTDTPVTNVDTDKPVTDKPVTNVDTDKEENGDKDSDKVKEESKADSEKAKEDELKKAGQKSFVTSIATVMAMFGFGLVWFSTKAKKEQDEK